MGCKNGTVIENVTTTIYEILNSQNYSLNWTNATNVSFDVTYFDGAWANETVLDACWVRVESVLDQCWIRVGSVLNPC